MKQNMSKNMNQQMNTHTKTIDKEETDLTSKRILIYLGLTFLITYTYEFLIVYPVTFSPDPTVAGLSTFTVSIAMFLPALGVLFTRLLTKEGFHNVWIRPNFKGHIRYYVMGWFGPAVLTMIGMGLYFLIFPDKFDANMTFLQNTFASVGQEFTAESLKNTILIQIAVAFFLAPLLNGINCFGEEWGWRGYLLPKMMEKFPIGKVLIMNGIIWGLWHAPIIAIGHNYGVGYKGWPTAGILAMCGFCIVMGIIFSYITLKTGSCLPAVLAHGSLNGIGATGVYLTKDGGNPFIGPSPTGIIGAAAFIVVAVIMAVLLIKEERAVQN